MQQTLKAFIDRISDASIIGGGESPILLPCLESIGAGEGSELWTFEAAGALKTATGAKCVQVGSQGSISWRNLERKSIEMNC